ncbi:unnamed protein product [Moneuplotes crassus]|uniref:Uncharacterized protein n=1 Tax=Euplotes crassus TaxID=5936 RepID=A0AAD2CZG9_EUPCR|nr:unnamed protein product [Moneuplotes crassus]
MDCHKLHCNNSKVVPEYLVEKGAHSPDEKLSDRYVINKSRFIRNKTEAEIHFLEDQFTQDPSWSRKTVQFCKDHLDLGTTQIYKWGFDKKKLLKKYSRTVSRLSNNAKPGDKEYFKAFFSYLKLLNQKKSKKFRQQKKIQESSKTEDRSEPMRISQPKSDTKVIGLEKPIDYNTEVGEILKLVAHQEDIGINRSSDLKDNFSRSLDQKSAKQDSSSSDNHSSWLDELWREEFNANTYISNSSDFITVTSPFENDQVRYSFEQGFKISEGMTQNLRNIKDPYLCNFFTQGNL